MPQSVSPTMILYTSLEDTVALQKSLCSTPRRNSSPLTGAPNPNKSALITTSNESGWQVTLTVFTCTRPSASCAGCLVIWGLEACCVWCLGGKAKDDLTQIPDSKSPARRLTHKYKLSMNITRNSKLVLNVKALVWATRQQTGLSRVAFKLYAISFMTAAPHTWGWSSANQLPTETQKPDWRCVFPKQSEGENPCVFPLFGSFWIYCYLVLFLWNKNSGSLYEVRKKKHY